MKWRVRGGVVFALFFITFAIISGVNSTTVQTSVPIVNECNGIPSLFYKHWHYRNTFDVVIKNGGKVKFELQDPKSLEEGKFFVTCLHNTRENEVRLKFSKSDPSTQEIVINTTCVPTVGVLNLCNKPTKNLVVNLATTGNGTLQPLPKIAFKSFETYDYNKGDSEKFLNQIQTYGFVNTPKAQVLIGKVDVDELLKNDRFIGGLKVINDVIEKYDEYSGRSAIPVAKGPRINMNLEKHTLLLKSEECIPNIYERRYENRTFIVDFKPNHRDNNHQYKTSCRVAAYYTFDRVVQIGKDILDFFTVDARKWGLLHEIGHHYDLRTIDYNIGLEDIWNNLYAAFYQSRFVYENKQDYWMQHNSADNVEQVYDTKTKLQKFGYQPAAHFFMALFTLDNHDASVFRSFNIRAMNDKETTDNILKSIAIFIRDQYNVNVAPFIEPVVYQEIPWLNLTNIYDLASTKNFRMPCFYYSDDESVSPNRRYRFVEHYLKPATNLSLCSTIMDTAKKIEITVKNPQLTGKSIQLNSLEYKVTQNPILIDSRDTVFAVWGNLNNTAVVLPTYAFCSPKTEYKCTVVPKLLTYSDQNPSQLFPPFAFDILGLGDTRIAILQIDISNKKFMIRTLVKDPHSYFPNEKGAYVTIELYNPSKSPIATYKINGTKMPIEEVFFDIDLNYTFELKALEKFRVKVFNYSLNDFETSTFKIYEFGIAEVSEKRSKIANSFAKILLSDLEYKPYLKKYQHLTDLLRILQTK